MWSNRAKGNKYGNTKTKIAGHWFDSRSEAALFSLLQLRERAGEIRDLASQPGTIFLSKSRIQYRPDFRYVLVGTEEIEHAEFKGFETGVWRLKRKLWIDYGPTKLHIWRGSVSSLKLHETIGPGETE